MSKPSRARVLNVVILLLAAVVLFLGYGFLQRLLHPPVDPFREEGGILQVDVLNGCGAQGVATQWTNFLRARGFDVVEMRNYKAFDVKESLVIDRTGVREHAEKVAQALGVRRENIVRQINEDYFVDVTVVIGRDYPSLHPSH